MLAPRLFVAFGFVVSLALAVAAGPREDGIAAYNKEDYLTALRIFRPLAEQDNSAAQYFLGRLYSKGEGVPQDYVGRLNGSILLSHEPTRPTMGKPKLAMAEEGRTEVSAKMNPSQITAAQRLASVWKPR
jgi:TPR repeat protein